LPHIGQIHSEVEVHMAVVCVTLYSQRMYDRRRDRLRIIAGREQVPYVSDYSSTDKRILVLKHHVQGSRADSNRTIEPKEDVQPRAKHIRRFLVRDQAFLQGSLGNVAREPVGWDCEMPPGCC